MLMAAIFVALLLMISINVPIAVALAMDAPAMMIATGLALRSFE